MMLKKKTQVVRGVSLRVAALSLQLTIHSTSITAQEAHKDPMREPTLVRNGKGEIQDTLLLSIPHVAK